MDLLIPIIIGLIIAAVIMFMLHGQMKTVKMNDEASDYIKKGSFHLSRSRDVFLYKRVEKQRKEQQNE